MNFQHRAERLTDLLSVYVPEIYNRELFVEEIRVALMDVYEAAKGRNNEGDLRSPDGSRPSDTAAGTDLK